MITRQLLIFSLPTKASLSPVLQPALRLGATSNYKQKTKYDKAKPNTSAHQQDQAYTYYSYAPSKGTSRQQLLISYSMAVFVGTTHARLEANHIHLLR
jgi:hypothetical protein